MSREVPNYYQLANLRFRVSLLEAVIQSSQQGILALIDLFQFIEYYNQQLHSLGEFGTHNQAVSSIIAIRNSIVNSINNINRL
ncbi:MAG: hypothetical protein RLZZ574_2160 [Cyanobacteriota bacterium]